MITTKDLAKICNVSRGTVDRALNGRPGISEETRQYVLKIAKECNYYPDLLARALVKGKTYTIGIIVFDLLNRYFAQIINSVEKYASARGYHINIMLSQKNLDTERENISRLAALKADGVLLYPINFDPAFEDMLQKTDLPVVTIGNRLSDSWSYVGIDDYAAAQTGVRYILQKNYDQIAFLCPPMRREGTENVSAQQMRRDGFISAVRDAGVPYVIWEKNDYYRAIDECIAEGKHLAVFCSSDTYVLRLYDYARQKKYDIPGQLGLMGFDNVDTLKYLPVRIATIDTAMESVGERAAALLIDMIENGVPSNTVYVDHQLITGDTL